MEQVEQDPDFIALSRQFKATAMELISVLEQVTQGLIFFVILHLNISVASGFMPAVLCKGAAPWNICSAFHFSPILVFFLLITAILLCFSCRFHFVNYKVLHCAYKIHFQYFVLIFWCLTGSFHAFCSLTMRPVPIVEYL